VRLQPLTADNMEQVRIWRNQVPQTLRTPYLLTAEQQAEYYRKVICNRESHTRYFALIQNVPTQVGTHDTAPVERFVGYGGIEGIQWETRIGELSLLIGPEYRRRGYGKRAVSCILAHAWDVLGLETVYAECYECGAPEFWRTIAKQHRAETTTLPRRKYWDGQYWDSLYITFTPQIPEPGPERDAHGVAWISIPQGDYISDYPN